MNVQVPPSSWAPRPHQLAVWGDLEAQVPNVLVIAHRRWGKDEIALADCAVRAADRAANYLFCLPEQEHARRAIWTSINPHTGRRRILEAFPDGFRVGAPKEQEMALEVRSRRPPGVVVHYDPHAPQHYRSRIQFLGSDNYDAIIGASPYGLYFDEWAVADPQALAMLRPAVAENGGFMRFLTTPRGKNHVWRQMEEQRGTPGWAVHYATVTETGVFAAAQLDELKAEAVGLYGRDVGESLYRQEYLCTFESIVPGSFYSDLLLRAEAEQRITRVLPVPEEPVYAAFDLGWRDATAIWYAQVRRGGLVDLLGYEEVHKMSVTDVVGLLRGKPWSYGALLLPHDAAQHEVTSGETVESLLLRQGFRCRVMPRTDEAAQVQSVRLLLPRCEFDAEDCARGLECLRAYHNAYREETQSWSPKAVHDWSSHGAKAFATLAFFASALRAGVSDRPGAAVPWGEADRPRLAGIGGYGWMR